ncbi:TPA: DUF975 family protein [Streptococcus suis]|uniref:DUF975 family protein n=1 Tax=Streptococcus suis TaxID=1307 RepID=UPI00209AA133|nr:DUF975 family protein [Streptococcus suis]MCO8200342.1 DUF975 family protein [Streptococcus suis]MCO8217879.1 DUF975 family protein [Streptococcus suis]HEM3468069.1 DUF975 family protein [Streptococcus suis]HEM3478780.1 DUF975 family protein [Streptococcus suis]
MSNSDIRAKATVIREQTDGMITLFLAPVLISFLSGVAEFGLKQIWGQTSTFSWGTTIVKDGVAWTHHFISVGPSIIFDFIAQCLIVTACFQLIRLVRKQRSKVSFTECFTLLDGKNFLPVFSTTLLKMLVLYLASFPAVIGMILINLAFYSTIVIFGTPIDYQPDFSAFFSSSYFQTGFILVCVGIICSLFVGYGLSQVSFLLYDYLENNTYSSPFKLFSQSWQLMKGNKWRRFLLDLSFVGWFIGVLLTFGFLGLYVYPYYWTCQTIFYEDLKSKNPLVFSTYKSAISSTVA